MKSSDQFILKSISVFFFFQPLELNILPPCQHCNKQPYPFLMIVSEGQEQSYSGSSIMSLTSHVPGAISGQSGDISNSSQSQSGTATPHNQLQTLETTTSNGSVSDTLPVITRGE